MNLFDIVKFNYWRSSWTIYCIYFCI